MTLSLRGAGVCYGGRWIFRNVNIDVNEGRCTALLGANGRGKTTLIRALLGMQALDEGEWCGPAVIGYVPQLAGTPVPYRVLEMVVMGRARHLGTFSAPTRTDYKQAREALQAVGLYHLADQPYHRISGGERQLVLIARALATDARTIILDEPASALDLANQSRLLEIIHGLRISIGYTILFSTHSPQHALHVADETILMMPEGQVLQANTDEILTEKNLSTLYGVPVRRVPVRGEVDAMVPLMLESSRNGGINSGVRCQSDKNESVLLSKEVLP